MTVEAEKKGSIWRRRGDQGGGVAQELGAFFQEVEGLDLGYTITSTTRNEDTHPGVNSKGNKRYKTGSAHFTGNAFDLGIKSEDDLGLMKYLFGQDFDPNAKVNGEYVRPDLTPNGVALFKKHNIRMIDERLAVDSSGVAQPHYHFEAVDSTKAKKIKKGSDFNFNTSASQGKDNKNFFFYGGNLNEFAENDFNTSQVYQDSIPNGPIIKFKQKITGNQQFDFNWSNSINKDFKTSLSAVLGSSPTGNDVSFKPNIVDPVTGEKLSMDNNVNYSNSQLNQVDKKTDPTTVVVEENNQHKNNKHKNVNLDGNVEVQSNGNFLDPKKVANNGAGGFGDEVISGIPTGTQTTGGNITTGINTAETTETTETTEKFKHKDKQVEANANNPEYVEKLVARGFTVQDYLENPQNTLNELSKLSDLDKSLDGLNENVELTTSQGPKKKKVEEGKYEIIEEEEQDDVDDFPDITDKSKAKVEGEVDDDLINQLAKGENVDVNNLNEAPDERVVTNVQNYNTTESFGLDRMGGGGGPTGAGAQLVILSKDDIKYVDETKNGLEDAGVKIGANENGLDISTENILDKKDHENAVKLVEEHDKKSTNSALAHLTQMYPKAKFSNKQEWLNYASKNNIDGELAFQDATPSETEDVTKARELMASNRELFTEIFSLSKYSGSHLNKVVALFGGHESENLDFGLLAKEMEAASLMFFTNTETARLKNNLALDLNKDRKNEIIYKSKMYVLNEYVKKTEDQSCDLENDINLFNDAETDLLKEKNIYETELQRLNDLKKVVSENSTFERNPDNTERTTGYINEDVAKKAQEEINNSLPGLNAKRESLLTTYDNLEKEKVELNQRQDDLKAEYEAVFKALNFNAAEGVFNKHNFENLEGEFKAWENGLKHIPVVGHIFNIGMSYYNAKLQLRGSLKASNAVLKGGVRNNLFTLALFEGLGYLEKEENVGGGYGPQSLVTDYLLELIAPSEGYLPYDKDATPWKNLDAFGKIESLKDAPGALGEFFSWDNLRSENPGEFLYHTAHSIFTGLSYVQELAKAKVNIKKIAKSNRIGKGDMRYKLNKDGMNWVSRLGYKVKGSETLNRSLAQVKLNQKLIGFEGMADGRARGLDPEKAFLYAQATSLATGVSQAIIPEYKWFNTLMGKKAQNNLITGLKKLKSGDLKAITNWKKTIGPSFATLIPDMIGEFGEEFLDMALNDVVKSSFLTNYSPEIQDVNAVGQMISATFFLTGGLGAQKGRRNMRMRKQKVYAYYAKKSGKLITEVDNQINAIQSAMDNIPDKRTKAGRELKQIHLQEIKKLKATKEQAVLIQQAQSQLSKYSTVQEVDLVMKKLKLQKQVAGLDPYSAGATEINNQIKEINKQIQETGSVKSGVELLNKSINNMVSLFGTSKSDVENGSIIVLDQDEYDNESEKRSIQIQKINDEVDQRIEEIDKQIQELTDEESNVKHKDKKNKKKIKKLQKDKRTLNDSKVALVDGSVQPGFFYQKDGKFFFVINKEAAIRSGNFFVAGHESFHALLFQTSQTKQGKKIIKAMGFALLNKLKQTYGKSFSQSYVGGKFMKGMEDGVYLNKSTGEIQWEEVLTIFSEALAQGDIQMSTGFLGQVTSLFRRMGRETGLNWKIKSTQDVINFIKDYNREFMRGRFSKGFSKIKNQGLVNVSSEFIRQNQQMADVQEQRALEKEVGIDSSVDVEQDPIEKQTEGKASIEFERDPELNVINEEDFEDFSEDEQLVRDLVLGYTIESWKNGGAKKAAEIIQQLNIFDRLIAAKLKVARSPEETKDFVKRVYSALYSDILGFNLENDDFFAYLNSRVSFRAGDVYNEEQKGKVEDRTGEDVGDMKDVANIIDDSDADNVQDEELDGKVHVGKKLGLLAEFNKVITRGFELINQGPAKTKEKEAARIKELDELGFIDGEGKIIDLNKSYKDMPNILYKVIAKRFGVDAEKLSPYSKKPFAKNLRRQKQRGSNELLNAQMALKKLGMEFLGAILPEGHTSTYEATGISRTKYKDFYNKGKRVRNNFIWHKKPIVDVALLESMIGIIDGKSFREDRLAQQSVISMLNIIGTVATIQTIVDVSKRTGDLDNLVRANMEDGKSKMAQSVFFSRYATQAQQAIVREELSVIKEEIELIEDRYIGEELVGKIKDIFKNTFGDRLNRVDAKGKKVNGAIELANQLFGATGLLTQYGTIKANYEIMGMEVPRGLDKFVQENLQSKEKNDIDVFGKFGMTGPDGGTLTKNAAFTKKGIINGRKNLVNKVKEIEKLVESGNLSKKEAYEWLFMMKAMYSSQGVLGDNTFMPKSDGSYRLVKSTSERGQTKQYSQVAFSASDYVALVNRANTVFKLGDTKYNNKIQKDLGIEKGYSESSKAVIEEMQKGSFDFESRKEQAMQARRLITFMVKIATERYNNQDDLFNEMDVVQELFMFGSSMESVSRKAAYVYGMAEGLMVNGKYTGDISKVGQELEYDHLTPHHQLMLKIADIVKSNNAENVEKDLENIFEEFVVNIIPKKMDKIVSKMGMQYLMQENYEEGKKLGDLKGALGRMYGEKTLGDPELKVIISLDGKQTRHGDGYVRLQKETSAAANSKSSISYTRAIRKSDQMAKDNQVKGISIWDFDDTLARSNSQVLFTTPDGTTGKLTAEEFAAKGADLLEQGYVYDFSEFSKVVDGRPGPFLQKFINRIKKFGIKDNFILTARPVNSAASIQLFLKGVGIDIPIENITGLANSTPESKALWIVDKVGDGYNDIYFADDALQNVQVVKNVLDQFDIKSKVRQAKGKQSINYSRQFNEMLERKSGVDAEKRFSKTKGEKRGEGKGRFQLWIAPSAEDFAGLLYNFIGKGVQGDLDYKFFEEILLRPFAKAHNKINTAKQQSSNEYKDLLKQSGLRKRLKELILNNDFIVEDAVRVYLWNKAGYEVPGLSETDLANLLDIVESDQDLKAFADSLGLISRASEGYVEPTDEWISQGISYDINQKGNEVRRKDYLTEFVENRKAIFGDWNGKGELEGENMNKIEALYGKNVREALQDILWRMENGTNRNIGKNKMVNNFMNYINGSIGATMFFNARSAVLQTISAVNFINWEDNNLFNAASAFANQGQYWEDFSFLFNSDMLKQRRSGLQQDLNAAELMQSVSRTKGFTGKTNAAIRFILQKGFLPTQMADSFAIASGGATFYRNRINKYLSEGMSETDAKEKAFVDFQEIAEKTQQSSRPDLISQEQASVLGRLVLAFQNTPMQYSRIQKKAFLDLINGRGDAKSHVSKIIYYGFAQNLIFYSLQSALFALPFLDDDEEEEFLKGKKERMLNSMLDGSLRGIGIYGAIVSTIKNMVRRFNIEADKGGRADYEYVVLEFANFSPPVGIKLRKMYNALQTYKFNRDEIEEGQWMLGAEAISGVVEAGTNIPLNRAINKVNNLSESLDSQNAIWQRIAMVLGWNRWDVGLNRKQKSATSAGGRRIIDRKKSSRKIIDRRVINPKKSKRRVVNI
tara:strand:- start:228 stop:10646 length:10419 start_codon:yes stop_codon:yes gene_type:complete